MIRTILLTANFLGILLLLGACSKGKEDPEKAIPSIDSASFHTKTQSESIKNGNVLPLLDRIPLKKIPFSINDSIFYTLDTSAAFSIAESEKLRLIELMGEEKHFKYIPIARFELDSTYFMILVIKYYLEESFANLITYSKDGEFIDNVNVFQENSGGDDWKTANLSISHKLIIETGSIYRNEGAPQLDTLTFSPFGSFLQAATKSPQSVKINGIDYPAVFTYGHLTNFNVGTGSDESIILDQNTLHALWSDSSQTSRADTANGKSYFYSYQSIADSLQKFTISYLGGCHELWYFIFDLQGNLKSNFSVSETCESDAEDYSFSHFISPTILEKTATWINEYPDSGENPNKSKITQFKISKNGTVSETLIRESQH